MSFVKLHGSILDSSIWSQADTIRLVWITMLTMANENGVVEASVDGLARRAVVSMESCEAALIALLGPDPRSRDGTAGERIEKVPGGWLVLNHGNYRERRTTQQIATAERVAKHRSRLKLAGAVTGNAAPRYTPLHLGDLKLSPSEAEAEAEAEADPEKNPPTPRKRGASSKSAADLEGMISVEEPWIAEAIRGWIAYRAEKRQAPYRRAGLKALVSKVRKMGQVRARAAMEHSMSSNYQGLYEPATGGQAAKPKTGRFIPDGSSYPSRTPEEIYGQRGAGNGAL